MTFLKFMKWSSLQNWVLNIFFKVRQYDEINSWKRKDAAEQISSWIERFLERYCRTEQILDRIDFWKRQDAAEQSSSWIEYISGKDRMLQSKAVPGQNRFMKKTGCCRAEYILERIDFWKRRDAVEQSSSWIEQISGKDRVLQNRADPGQNGFMEKAGCRRAEDFLDI